MVARAALAAETISAAECALTGQVCYSLTRLVVLERQHDAFVEALASAFAAVKVGDPYADDTHMGARCRLPRSCSPGRLVTTPSGPTSHSGSAGSSSPASGGRGESRACGSSWNRRPSSSTRSPAPTPDQWHCLTFRGRSAARRRRAEHALTALLLDSYMTDS
jgi:hypothetical protein